MGWLILLYLMAQNKKGGSSSSSSSSSTKGRPVPVLHQGENRLWLVRELPLSPSETDQLFELSTDSDKPVLLYTAHGGTNTLRLRFSEATEKDVDEATLDFKLRSAA